MTRKQLGVCALLCIFACQVSDAGVGGSKSKVTIEDDGMVEDEKSAQEETIAEETKSEKKAQLELSEQELLSREQVQSKECKQILKALRGGPDSLVKQYLTPDSNEHLRTTCANIAYDMKKSPKERARDEIKKMVGELKWVEPGSFLMGSEKGEPDYLKNNQKPHYVEIKEGYWLPVDVMTVANYHYVMTGEWITKENEEVKAWMKEEKKEKAKKRSNEEKDEKKEKKKAGASQYPDLEFLIQNEKKPMRGLTEAQWDKFTKKLNEKIAKLWPVAYRDLYEKHGNKVPKFDRPEDYELEFATTIPLEKEEEVDNPAHEADKKTPAKVKITAKHSLFSGTDKKVKFDKDGRLDKAGEDYKEISKYVVCQRKWEDGPSDVDSVLPNARGFRNLSGNIWKQTKTLYRLGSSYRVLVGGGWASYALNARSASRAWDPDNANSDVGFLPRAVLK